MSCDHFSHSLTITCPFFPPEYEKDGSFVPLQEVDASSEVIGEVTMLNTLKHYKVRNGSIETKLYPLKKALNFCHI